MNQASGIRPRSRGELFASDYLSRQAGTRWPVDLAVPQHGIDQPDQLSGGEDEGPPMTMAGGLLMLFSVVGTELRAMDPHRVWSYRQ